MLRAIGLITLIAVSTAAEPRWIVMRLGNFEVFSTAGERATRDTVRQFQQARNFFNQALPSLQGGDVPVRVVVFGSKKEYEPYKFNEFAAAYYHSSGQHDYIVMSSAGAENFPIAVHEYVHLLVRHSGIKLPIWLNEGLAELYSTIRPMGDKVLVGDIIPGHMQWLLTEKWTPLPIILAAGHDSPYYNEKNKAGSLYNESWALTHMLVLSDEYRGGFTKMLAAILSGTPSEQALTATYGKPIGQIQKELNAYPLQGGLFPAGLDKIGDKIEPEAAPEIDVLLTLVNSPTGQATNNGLERPTSRSSKRPQAARPARRPRILGVEKRPARHRHAAFSDCVRFRQSPPQIAVGLRAARNQERSSLCRTGLD